MNKTRVVKPLRRFHLWILSGEWAVGNLGPGVLVKMFVCLFVWLIVCLFVGVKPEKLYSTSFVWREVKPLGATTHGLRHCYVRETKTAAQTKYLSIEGNYKLPSNQRLGCLDAGNSPPAK